MNAPITPRCSSLDLALLCPLAPHLDAKHPETMRAAIMSQWLHAKAAGKREAEHLWNTLSEKEQSDVQTWFIPGDCEIDGGHVLRYAEALKEIPVACTSEFRATLHGAPDAYYQGTLDFAWITELDGMRVGYIADIKKQRFTVEGPDILQIKAYALAGVAKWELDAYCTGLWLAEEGKWVWSQQGIITVGSAQWAKDMKTVSAAVDNANGEQVAVMGKHCGSCYSRLHCPAYMLPAQESLIGPALANELTEENALAALLELERLEDQTEAARKNLREAVRRGLRIYDGDKKYAPVRCSGRATVSVKLLAEKYPDIAQNVTRVGAAYDQVRWVNR